MPILAEFDISGQIIPVVVSLVAAIVGLYKINQSMYEKNAEANKESYEKLEKRSEVCEKERKEGTEKLLELTGRVSKLEGFMEGHEQAREDWKEGIKELSDTVLKKIHE